MISPQPGGVLISALYTKHLTITKTEVTVTQENKTAKKIAVSSGATGQKNQRLRKGAGGTVGNPNDSSPTSVNTN